MVFTSFEFIVFFSVFYLSFIFTPHRFRLHLILLASIFFFGYANPQHLWLLILTILVGYASGIAMAANPQRKSLYMWLGVCTLLGLLGFFKYTDFAISALNPVLAPENRITPLQLVLPIGISFFVFQAISYVVDVYRGDKSVERNLLVLAVYKSFFPQLVAGPIERSTHLLPLIRAAYVDGRASELVSPEAIRSGSRLILLGFFKKICIADNLALFSDNVFSSPGSYGTVATVLGVYSFAIQIYCDFSGYTDIARGLARIMGIDLMENFKRPYFSASIGEFWTRWHISLSSWFRDYLYKPLGGSRVGLWRWVVNIMAVFILSGLWHGAAVNFIIWGAIHGVIYLVERAVINIKQRLLGFPLVMRISGNSSPSGVNVGDGRSKTPGSVNKRTGRTTGLMLRSLAIIFTFHVVCLAWIFFRSPTFADALEILRSIASIGEGQDLMLGFALFERASFVWCLAFIAFLFIVDLYQELQSGLLQALFEHTFVRWTVYILGAAAILLLGNLSASQQFIYFQF